VYRAPFVVTSIASETLGLARPSLTRRELDVRRPALWTDRMIEIRFQSINDVAGF